MCLKCLQWHLRDVKHRGLGRFQNNLIYIRAEGCIWRISENLGPSNTRTCIRAGWSETSILEGFRSWLCSATAALTCVGHPAPSNWRGTWRPPEVPSSHQLCHSMILWGAGHQPVVLAFQIAPKVIWGGRTPGSVCCAKRGGYHSITEKWKNSKICPWWSLNLVAEPYVKPTSGLLLNMDGGSSPSVWPGSWEGGLQHLAVTSL